MNVDVLYGHGVRRRNSNILKRHQFELQGTECDFVDNAGVFLAKDCVVACNPQEVVLNDWFKEDHVGLCILYCPMTMLVVMIIWKWPLAQIILDGYTFIEHLISFNETHIPNVDDVGVVGVKKIYIPFIKGSEV
jgi:hypothetical protein